MIPEKKEPRRKLQQIGGYTFYVTLPQRWLEHHNIGRGDEIEFEFNEDDMLVLKPIRVIRPMDEPLINTSDDKTN